MLSPADFTAFYEEVHGYAPFPWQTRLLRRVAVQGTWPATLDLPTGSGKTAAMDIAVFHLALEASRGAERRAPVRVAFVVDRRLIVDDAFERARRLEKALASPTGATTELVANALRGLADGGSPLLAQRLRGGLPREDNWARMPTHPTVLCSTVDQVGSRLLFRGYGTSDSMKPVHAGLLGSDSLLLLDEAHLAEPFRQTLDWVRVYQSESWREEAGSSPPWGVSLLTATPGEEHQSDFSLDDEDRQHPVLRKRLEASKPARLIVAKARVDRRDETEGSDEAESADSEKETARRADLLVNEALRCLEHFKGAGGATAPAVGIVVNRVARARQVYKQLRQQLEPEIAANAIEEPILMIGPARPVDRDTLATALEPIRTRIWQEDERRALEKPLLIVATQCIEAGVDIDLDGLITEAAPLDSLRQRFGRLNRAGRDVAPYAAVVAMRSDLAARAYDPVYGTAIRACWNDLTKAGESQGKALVVDFGLTRFSVPMRAEALAPRADAPILLPAHLDLLSQTAPVPAASPDVALYLHGPDRRPDSISVIWRGDVDPDQSDRDTCRLLLLCPPRSAEAVQLPVWAVRRWLIAGEKRQDRLASDLADIPMMEPDEEQTRDQVTAQKVFRWRGDDERSQWLRASVLRPGDTIVVPASYGGLDSFGWDPASEVIVSDVGRVAAEPYAGRRFAVRVAPGLLGDEVSSETLAKTLVGATSQGQKGLREALLSLALPEDLLSDLKALDDANRRAINLYLDAYGRDEADRPRGVVFVAPLGLSQRPGTENGRANVTENDIAGSMPGYQLTLMQHSEDVGVKAELYAKLAGLPDDRVLDLRFAGMSHDLGKADSRFQAWLRYGDPLGCDEEPVLAKSARPLPRAARRASQLPARWRHEALSVRRAVECSDLADARDPELVLWLIGTHHGYGRPLFPHHDPNEQVPNVGPQSLAFDWHGLDWPSLFLRLKSRYGVWELARMEAVLRLADHRASEDRA